jgi:hypothetical protein
MQAELDRNALDDRSTSGVAPLANLSRLD